MDFWGYIANGGLERLLIIGVATLIGYWGYRIYSRSQTPGLALIALAAVVLFSVMLTSKQHLQSVNANLLAVASLESSVPSPDAADRSRPEDITLIAPVDAPLSPAETEIEDSEFQEPDAELSAVDATVVTQTPTAADEQPERIERLVSLASGQELGGRITSVRSEKLTLEWSTDTDNRQTIRPATPE